MGTATAAEKVVDQVLSIPLEDLHDTPHNPRKTFNEVEIRELAESLKQSGQIESAIARPRAKGGYELAAGHRRVRAARIAGFTHLDVRIREMDDATFVEIVNVDNLQRRDLEPMEEAQGFANLMTVSGYEVDGIAARIGRSVNYVYDRIKLLQLVPSATVLLQTGIITAGHAVLLARLSDEDQERAIDPDNGGLFQHEEVEPALDIDVPSPQKARSVRELQHWIDDHIRFRPEAIADLPVLFPETAIALQQAAESELKVVKITHDHFIRPDVKDENERVYGPQSWKPIGDTPCDHEVLGVFAVGVGRGTSQPVCIAKKKCQVHWPKAPESTKRADSEDDGDSETSSEQERWKREQEARAKREAKEEAERVRWKKAQPALVDAIVTALKKQPTGAAGVIGKMLVDRYGKRFTNAAKILPMGKSGDDLVRYLAFVLICETITSEWAAPERGPALLKPLGIDALKVVNAAVPVEKPKAETTPDVRKTECKPKAKSKPVAKKRSAKK